jgi:RecG-like helicase
MALPNITVPHFKLELPVSEKTITFRPFLVKEEKILLMAREAGDEESITQATQQIVDECIEGDIDVKDIPTFEMEYIFLNIRAKSVGEEVELRYRHSNGVNKKGEECDTSTVVNVNLEDVKVKFDSDHSKTIMLTNDVGIQMKYPTFGNADKIKKDSMVDIVSTIAHCIEYIFDKEQIYDDTTTTWEEKIQFIENLNQEQLLKINKFFDTMPRLEHEIVYKCSGCGQEDKITLRGITDFF